MKWFWWLGWVALVGAQERSGRVTGLVAVEGGGAPATEARVRVTCPGGTTAGAMTKGPFDLLMIGGSLTTGDTQIAACEIVISLAGYEPFVGKLSPSAVTNLGLVRLKPRAGARGMTHSGTSLMAPDEARAAYEKGLALAAKKKVGEAQRELEKAVKLYPRYAMAWLQLGALHQHEKRNEAAKAAFAKAWECDKQFVLPLLHLAAIESGEKNWKRAADLTDQLIEINPHEFPEAYLYNAAAFYNLGHLTPAEHSVRKAIELDTKNEYPRSYQLLGRIREERGDHAGAAEQYRAYLKHAPKGPDAPAVRARLAAVMR